MAKTFDQTLSESGKQNILDQLRKEGKYDQARAEFEAGRGEYYISPAQQAVNQASSNRTAFNNKLTEQSDAFLTRFREEYPTIISGIESNLGLPQLRQTAQTVTNQLEEVPEVQTTAARGKDISANQLQRIIGAETNKLAPIAQKAINQAQFAESEASRQADRALVPFQTEIDLMKDRFARESSGFNQDAESRLNLLITQINEEGAMDRAKLSEATKLAELEAQKDQYLNSLSTVDLGDRVALLDVNGNEVQSFSKGKLGTVGGASEWEYI